MGLPDEIIEEAGRRWWAAYRGRDEADLLPGAAEALERLHAAGYPLALVTAGHRDNVGAQLRRHGLERLLPVRVHGDDLPETKPHPAPLLRAIRELGLGADAAGTAYVGDALDDMRMARAAGAHAVGHRLGPRRRRRPAGRRGRRDGPVRRGLGRSIPRRAGVDSDGAGRRPAEQKSGTGERRGGAESAGTTRRPSEPDPGHAGEGSPDDASVPASRRRFDSVSGQPDLHAILVGDGDVPARAALDAAWPGWDAGAGLVVAADGGATKALAAGLAPDLVVGDGGFARRRPGWRPSGRPGSRSSWPPWRRTSPTWSWRSLAAVARGATRLTILGALGGAALRPRPGERVAARPPRARRAGRRPPRRGDPGPAPRRHGRAGRGPPRRGAPATSSRSSRSAPTPPASRPTGLAYPLRDEPLRDRPRARPLQRPIRSRGARRAAGRPPADRRDAPARRDPMSSAPLAAPAAPDTRWRTRDIVVTAVIGVAFGVVFWAWGLAWAPIEAALGPARFLFYAVWLVPAVLAPLIVRKPGAALFAEMLAAAVSTLIGSQWGPDTLLSGFVQGAAAELVFAFTLYRLWSFPVARPGRDRLRRRGLGPRLGPLLPGGRPGDDDPLRRPDGRLGRRHRRRRIALPRPGAAPGRRPRGLPGRRSLSEPGRRRVVAAGRAPARARTRSPSSPATSPSPIRAGPRPAVAGVSFDLAPGACLVVVGPVRIGQEHPGPGDRRARAVGGARAARRGPPPRRPARREHRSRRPSSPASGSSSRTRPASWSWSGRRTTSRSGWRAAAGSRPRCAPGCPRRSPRPASAGSSGAGRRGSRAASSSASPSPARSPRVPASSSSTSRRPTSTRPAPWPSPSGWRRVRATRATTIVLVEHRADLAWPLADLVLALTADGTPLALGTPAELLARHRPALVAAGIWLPDEPCAAPAGGRGLAAARRRRRPRRAAPARAEARGVDFAFERGIPVLSGLDLAIEPGARIALLGPNGSGKSTAARLLVGLLRPTRGTVRVAGRDPARIAPRELARLAGYVTQDPGAVLPGRHGGGRPPPRA